MALQIVCSCPWAVWEMAKTTNESVKVICAVIHQQDKNYNIWIAERAPVSRHSVEGLH